VSRCSRRPFHEPFGHARDERVDLIGSSFASVSTTRRRRAESSCHTRAESHPR
jgi:hypothetical protein